MTPVERFDIVDFLNEKVFEEERFVTDGHTVNDRKLDKSVTDEELSYRLRFTPTDDDELEAGFQSIIQKLV